MSLTIAVSAITAFTTLVHEKHTRVIGALRMAGLSEGAYWLSWSTYFLPLSASTALVTCGVGTVLDAEVFEVVDGSLMFWTLLLSVYAYVTFAMFLGSMITSHS